MKNQSLHLGPRSGQVHARHHATVPPRCPRLSKWVPRASRNVCHWEVSESETVWEPPSLSSSCFANPKQCLQVTSRKEGRARRLRLALAALSWSTPHGTTSWPAPRAPPCLQKAPQGPHAAATHPTSLLGLGSSLASTRLSHFSRAPCSPP